MSSFLASSFPIHHTRTWRLLPKKHLILPVITTVVSRKVQLHANAPFAICNSPSKIILANLLSLISCFAGIVKASSIQAVPFQEIPLFEMLFVSFATYNTKRTGVEFMCTQTICISKRLTELLLTSLGFFEQGRRKIEALSFYSKQKQNKLPFLSYIIYILCMYWCTEKHSGSKTKGFPSSFSLKVYILYCHLLFLQEGISETWDSETWVCHGVLLWVNNCHCDFLSVRVKWGCNVPILFRSLQIIS